jgi:o-succinylbenzoate synthase
MDGGAPPIGLTEAWAAVGERGAFALDCVELWWIDVPFVRPVSTAVGVHRNRPLVLVQLRGSADGRPVDGWGECAALADTTYDAEDVAGSFFALEHRLVPALVQQAARSHGRLPRPSALDGIRRAAPGGTLAFAALEMAVADAHLRSESRSFAQVLGVENRQIEIGAVVGTSGDTGTLVDSVAALAAEGFTRVKMKIGPGWDVEPVGAVAALAAAIPGLRVQADANGSYSESDSAHLGRLDRFGLLCLEQPFDRSDLAAHARLARRLATPICLDESLDSPERTAAAISMGACSVVCVKPSRLGGLGAALRVVEDCRDAGIPMWIGGMYESGYARGVNTTLAAVPGFAWPGDLSPAATYLTDGLVEPLGLVRSPSNGALVASVPSGGGMGPAPDPATLERLLVRRSRVAGRGG